MGRGLAARAPVNSANQVQILTNPGVDAQGRPTYRLALVNNELIANSFQTSTNTRAQAYQDGGSDVYQIMLSVRVPLQLTRVAVQYGRRSKWGGGRSSVRPPCALRESLGGHLTA